MDFNEFEVWFVTGSQHLYGEAALKKVAEHSQEMARDDTVGQTAGEGRIQTGRDDPRCHHRNLPRSQ